jgi:hypothetical protein
MEKYPIREVNGTKEANLKIAVVGAGLVSFYALTIFGKILFPI